ncbi:hypothetical protein BO85DRAFT_184573 [Aspergillus piperis CBS 112811]|uniref:Uncharacterized protein n=1 Tax=Aspergillus piperis CBS 112811 TaxID=1448313 RepID=A0A8G1R883_9EURO|nr:hypothetical protein BO85DRAFT_184573 [Aspergillus piperis CBS 112811]RAH61007.1 hypothetical protein BO85DRAFT_184573 [Aspergillus piperis CBS 112811]
MRRLRCSRLVPRRIREIRMAFWPLIWLRIVRYGAISCKRRRGRESSYSLSICWIGKDRWMEDIRRINTRSLSLILSGSSNNCFHIIFVLVINRFMTSSLSRHVSHHIV